MTDYKPEVFRCNDCAFVGHIKALPFKRCTDCGSENVEVFLSMNLIIDLLGVVERLKAKVREQ